MISVLVLTVVTDLIIAVVAGLIMASFVFMKKISDIAERETTLTPIGDQPWADELAIPVAIRGKLFIKHIDGPLFFGFASQFLDIARQAMSQSKLLVLRVLVVGISVTHVDLLERLQVIPAVILESDVFSDFDALKNALPGIIGKMTPQASSG